MTPRQAELLAPEFTPSEPRPAKRSKLDPVDLFAAQCRSYRLPAVLREYYFAKSIGRRWRFDFAFEQYMLAVEIEGLVVRRVWSAELEGGGPVKVGEYVRNVKNVEALTVAMGRHATITGFREDCEKYASSTMLGWRLLRFEQTMIKSEYAIEMTMRTLAAIGWRGPNAVGS